MLAGIATAVYKALDLDVNLAGIAKLMERMDALRLLSPPPPERFFNKAQAKIRCAFTISAPISRRRRPEKGG